MSILIISCSSEIGKITTIEKQVSEIHIDKDFIIIKHPKSHSTLSEIVTIEVFPEVREVTYDKYEIRSTEYKTDWWALLLTGVATAILVSYVARVDTAKFKDYALAGLVGATVIIGISNIDRTEIDTLYLGTYTDVRDAYSLENRSAYLEFEKDDKLISIFLGKFNSNNKLSFSLSELLGSSVYKFSSGEEVFDLLLYDNVRIEWPEINNQ